MPIPYTREAYCLSIDLPFLLSIFFVLKDGTFSGAEGCSLPPKTSLSLCTTENIRQSWDRLLCVGNETLILPICPDIFYRSTVFNEVGNNNCNVRARDGRISECLATMERKQETGKSHGKLPITSSQCGGQ